MTSEMMYPPFMFELSHTCVYPPWVISARSWLKFPIAHGKPVRPSRHAANRSSSSSSPLGRGLISLPSSSYWFCSPQSMNLEISSHLEVRCTRYSPASVISPYPLEMRCSVFGSGVHISKLELIFQLQHPSTDHRLT